MKIDRKTFDLLLAKRKWTLKEAAAKAGISDRTIYRGFESDVTPKHIGKLAEALGVTVENLIIKED